MPTGRGYIYTIQFAAETSSLTGFDDIFHYDTITSRCWFMPDNIENIVLTGGEAYQAYVNFNKILWVDDQGTGTGVSGGTYNNPYGSIQEGVDNADNGDTINVWPGVYIESQTVQISGSYDLKLVGDNRGEGYKPVINGNGTRRCMKIENASGEILVENFYFFNGIAAEGGGMYISRCSPTIKNCWFALNIADYRMHPPGYYYARGGAMRIRYGAGASIEDCEFAVNLAFGHQDPPIFPNPYQYSTQGSGGAVHITPDNRGAVTLRNCKFGVVVSWINPSDYDSVFTWIDGYRNLSDEWNQGGTFWTPLHIEDVCRVAVFYMSSGTGIRVAPWLADQAGTDGVGLNVLHCLP